MGNPIGRWCRDETFCLTCHPNACMDGSCCNVFVGDVAERNVGQVCDGCGNPMRPQVVVARLIPPVDPFTALHAWHNREVARAQELADRDIAAVEQRMREAGR